MQNTEDNREKRQKAIVNRLAKAIGHTKSIKMMVENGRDCSEVLIQLSAVKSEVNNTAREILKQYIRESVEDTVESGNPELIGELSRTISNLIK